MTRISIIIIIIAFVSFGLTLLIMSCAFAYKIITEAKDDHEERQKAKKGACK